MKTVNPHPLRDNIGIDIEGTFTAKIEVARSPEIAIERNLHLCREPDGTWFMYSIPNGDINVNDPTICAFLDIFYHLLADPERFGTAAFGSKDSAPENTAAA